ncbi:unnamed protein product [Meloidogyne enterolobii]|uniref:Uncharacterized protein n=1 Tax=Meloidogyne enterolobii TaxID=390850 RepID=A0ACB1AM72_MELEN
MSIHNIYYFVCLANFHNLYIFVLFLSFIVLNKNKHKILFKGDRTRKTFLKRCFYFILIFNEYKNMCF